MTYQRARAGLVLATAGLAALRLTHAFSLWWLALPLAVYSALLLYGASNIGSCFFVETHCGAKGTDKEIALTFDDGPDPEFTPRVLSALEGYGAPAAFFLIGRKVAGNEELVRRMHAAGHTLGNHSFTHSHFFDFKPLAALKDELTRTTDTIAKVIGKRVKYFRPPYGVTNANVAAASAELDYRVVGWNVRSRDWVIRDEERLARRVIGSIKPGAVILFHDRSETTVKVLERTLRYAKDNGYKIVSLERLLQIPAYE